jgi:hypothetical protein
MEEHPVYAVIMHLPSRTPLLAGLLTAAALASSGLAPIRVP